MISRLITTSSVNLTSVLRLGVPPALATIPLRAVASTSRQPCALPRSMSSMSAPARPRTQTCLLMTQIRAASTKPPSRQADTVAATTAHPHRASFDGVNHRGFADIVPFIKRIPVDVYPLVVFVSFVCCLGVFFSVKNMFTDKTLRLKPSVAGQGAGVDE